MSVQGCVTIPSASTLACVGDMRELGTCRAPNIVTVMAGHPTARTDSSLRSRDAVCSGRTSRNRRLRACHGAFSQKTVSRQRTTKSLSLKPVILFKGSRAMKLEQVVNPLLSAALKRLPLTNPVCSITYTPCAAIFRRSMSSSTSRFDPRDPFCRLWACRWWWARR